jgi:hypothetical protein
MNNREFSYLESPFFTYLALDLKLTTNQTCFNTEFSNTNNNKKYVFFLHNFAVLAAWFRLKYPHVVLGSLASSAPILYFDDISPQAGYYSLVTKDFKVTHQLFIF